MCFVSIHGSSHTKTASNTGARPFPSVEVLKKNQLNVAFSRTVRYAQYQQIKSTIERQEGSLAEFATGYHLYGFQRDAKSKSTVYREWAPNAVEASLIGDFSTHLTLSASRTAPGSTWCH